MEVTGKSTGFQLGISDFGFEDGHWSSAIFFGQQARYPAYQQPEDTNPRSRMRQVYLWGINGQPAKQAHLNKRKRLVLSILESQCWEIRTCATQCFTGVRRTGQRPGAQKKPACGRLGY